MERWRWILARGRGGAGIRFRPGAAEVRRRSGALPKIPARSFINDIEASAHDPNTAFAVVDVHKLGDYNPYLFMSIDRGKTWKSISYLYNYLTIPVLENFG